MNLYEEHTKQKPQTQMQK